MKPIEYYVAKAANFDGNVKQLCRELGCNRKWFYDFAKGRYSDTGYKRIRELSMYIDRDYKRNRDAA